MKSRLNLPPLLFFLPLFQPLFQPFFGVFYDGILSDYNREAEVPFVFRRGFPNESFVGDFNQRAKLSQQLEREKLRASLC